MRGGTLLELSTALVLDRRGAMLLVRKRGTAYFMQPGGKLEPGETPEEALVRELREELDLAVGPRDLAALGDFRSPAANEPGCEIHAWLYLLRLDADRTAVRPCAELDAIRWIAPTDDLPEKTAPYTRDRVLPLWRRTVDGRSA